MFRFILIRIASLLPILVGISVVTFSLIRLVPGDPVIALLGMEANEASIQALRSRLALD
jgi:peptide/nickel transport system permease protein